MHSALASVPSDIAPIVGSSNYIISLSIHFSIAELLTFQGLDQPNRSQILPNTDVHCMQKKRFLVYKQLYDEVHQGI